MLHENRQNLDGGTLGNPQYRENLHGFGKAKAGFCLKCGAWRGSLGLEPTFELYIKHLCDIFDEIKRVLRKDGTCWVVIGDSYGGSGNASGHTKDTKNLGYKTLEMGATQGNQRTTGQYAKSLLDIPYRFSIEMINRGWIKRNTIIWYKPNCMPSSANDRFTVDFEYLFFFTKNNKAIFWTNEKTLECVSKKPLGTNGIEGKDWEWRKDSKGKLKKVSFWHGYDYWFEQQVETADTNENRPPGVVRNREYNYQGKYKTNNPLPSGNKLYRDNHNKDYCGRNGTRNKRAVWTIPTQPFPEAHFAVYPEALIEPVIKAGCPEFVCKKCGKARVKIYKTIGKQITKSMKIAGCNKEGKYKGTEKKDYDLAFAQRPSETKKRILESMSQIKESYYTDCGCDAGWESGITLDPFMGAGTTALVALKQRKRFIGIEIKQEYIDMANKRIAKVQQEIF